VPPRRGQKGLLGKRGKRGVLPLFPFPLTLGLLLRDQAGVPVKAGEAARRAWP
jgi:hypothetical protein